MSSATFSLDAQGSSGLVVPVNERRRAACPSDRSAPAASQSKPAHTHAARSHTTANVPTRGCTPACVSRTDVDTLSGSTLFVGQYWGLQDPQAGRLHSSTQVQDIDVLLLELTILSASGVHDLSGA